MRPPGDDLEARRPVWDVLQMFWMDTDPALFVDTAGRICAASGYSVAELEAIYWNEVRPAVKFNLSGLDPAPQWTGFELGWLERRILDKHRFGRKLPVRALHPEDAKWWAVIEQAIVAARGGTPPGCGGGMLVPQVRAFARVAVTRVHQGEHP